MITFKYKDGYIHDNFTNKVIEVQFNDRLIRVNSVLSAKRLITKLMKEGKK